MLSSALPWARSLRPNRIHFMKERQYPFKNVIVFNTLPPPRDRPGPSCEYGDFMAPVPTTPPTPGSVAFVWFSLPFFSVAFCGMRREHFSPVQCLDEGQGSRELMTPEVLEHVQHHRQTLLRIYYLLLIVLLRINGRKRNRNLQFRDLKCSWVLRPLKGSFSCLLSSYIVKQTGFIPLFT